jgi:hypothetical protein
MHKQTVFAILAASLLIAGCNDSDVRISATSPGALIELPSTSFASIHPSFASAQLIRVGDCPHVHPFRVPFNLIIQAAGDVTVSLTEVRMQFTDNFGVTAPQVTLPAPVLTRQFGTALVLARSERTFPLDFSFGCGTGRIGTIVIQVRGRHGNGKDARAEMRLEVR